MTGSRHVRRFLSAASIPVHGVRWIGVFAAAAFVGCSPRTGHHIPDAPPAQPDELFQPFSAKSARLPDLVERPPYRLNSFDVLEIIYHVGAKQSEKAYRLKIEDVIEIKFPFQKDLNQELTVQSDGKVNCLLVGSRFVLGKDTDIIRDDLLTAYAQFIREPELTVIMKVGNKKIDELKKAITTAPRGQSRLIPIKPDGTIDLPYIGEVMAAGRTVQELRSALNREYLQAELEGVEVTVQTLEFAPRHVSVLGEVYARQMMTSNTPLTVLHALAAAGGTTTRADLDHVLVVRRKFLPVPEAVIVSVRGLLEGTKAGPDGLVPNGEQFRYDFYLQDEDIVYVPPTGLARLNDWVDQVFSRTVRPIFPVTGNIGLNFGYDIYNAPATISTRTLGNPKINTQIGP